MIASASHGRREAAKQAPAFQQVEGRGFKEQVVGPHGAGGSMQAGVCSRGPHGSTARPHISLPNAPPRRGALWTTRAEPAVADTAHGSVPVPTPPHGNSAVVASRRMGRRHVGQGQAGRCRRLPGSPRPPPPRRARLHACVYAAPGAPSLAVQARQRSRARLYEVNTPLTRRPHRVPRSPSRRRRPSRHAPWPLWPVEPGLRV